MQSADGVRFWTGLHFFNVYGEKTFTLCHALKYGTITDSQSRFY